MQFNARQPLQRGRGTLLCIFGLVQLAAAMGGMIGPGILRMPGMFDGAAPFPQWISAL